MSSPSPTNSFPPASSERQYRTVPHSCRRSISIFWRIILHIPSCQSMRAKERSLNRFRSPSHLLINPLNKSTVNAFASSRLVSSWSKWQFTIIPILVNLLGATLNLLGRLVGCRFSKPIYMCLQTPDQHRRLGELLESATAVRGDPTYLQLHHSQSR